MINVCSLDELWMSLPFFFSFYPLAPNLCQPHSFYESEICLFFLLGMWDKEYIVSSQGLRIFLCPMLGTRYKREKLKKKKTKLKNYDLSYSNFLILVWRIRYQIN